MITKSIPSYLYILSVSTLSLVHFFESSHYKTFGAKSLLFIKKGWNSNKGVTSCKLRVTIYCTSCKLLFIYELRVTIYCISYEFLFTFELRVITYCTSYEVIFTYELRVTIYCTSYVLFLYMSYELLFII